MTLSTPAGSATIAGLLEQFAHRPLGDGLAEFEHAARKAPAPGIGLLRALHDQRPLAAQHHRQHRRPSAGPDSAARPAGFEFGGGGSQPFAHCETSRAATIEATPRAADAAEIASRARNDSA